jgi:hypothetical protein
MRRTVVCLLIALASAGVAAREAKLSDADGSCPTRTQTAATRAPDRDPASMALPVKKAKPAPAPAASTGGGGDDVRLPSPRWHRFLPGMFR